MAATKVQISDSFAQIITWNITFIQDAHQFVQNTGKLSSEII